MQNKSIKYNINTLREKFEGEIFSDNMMRVLYSTDASAYRELPIAVAIPRNKTDIKRLISFATKNKISLIPRAAGTSLAGQVVGSGIIVDTSKHFNKILEINKEEKWVRVEPGVVPDELNNILAPLGLFWGPETSTSNRCRLGGMLGNNSCGSHSLVYGSTRDHTISVKTILSDESEVEFKPLSENEFKIKSEERSLEGKIYRFTNNLLREDKFIEEINYQFPDSSIKRRNTGYAIDIIAKMQPFAMNGEKFNLAKLLAGSEGTLAFTTEMKLNLVDLPPKNKVLVCVHLESVKAALHANIIALEFDPFSVELMDNTVINLTKGNKDQLQNRFFVKGNPGAILIIEFAEFDIETLHDKIKKMEITMRKHGYGYHFPKIEGSDMAKVWALRKAGLGVLSNMPGDLKPVAVIEDTAVKPEDLPNYIGEFNKILKKHNLSCVYYAHIGTGELHLRPVMNLKNPDHVNLFRTIGLETAKLVKKYRGSLSGEHGDGRLRGEFIPLMVGEKIYYSFVELKKVWDPKNIFNPGKIIATPPMNSNLRYSKDLPEKIINPIFNFSDVGGILSATEKCTGSGDCLKSDKIGGTMCPSYMATRDEKNSTRARANILREFLTFPKKQSHINDEDILEVLNLCLSCKACKSECPSSVDVTKLKAEFLQYYYDKNKVPLSVLMISNLPKLNRILSISPRISNYLISKNVFSSIIKNLLGFTEKRDLPKYSKTSLKKWFNRVVSETNKDINGTVYLFNDEFTNYQDSEIGIKSIMLLNRLGYKVILPYHLESGRTYLSKGLLRRAKKIANKNIFALKDIVSAEKPLLGIEPSAILSFRDEYPDLASDELKDVSKQLAKNCYTIDEFIHNEFLKGKITVNKFVTTKQKILVHGHCQQKAISSISSILNMLSIPKNYEVNEIPSGCCGMAGSFGYEKDKYELSIKIGNMVLFPAINESEKETIIAASGISCRCQIEDGTGTKALHPVEILYNALAV